MKSNRREFLKIAGMGGIGLASGSILQTCDFASKSKRISNNVTVDDVVTTLEDGSTLAIPFWKVEEL